MLRVCNLCLEKLNYDDDNDDDDDSDELVDESDHTADEEGSEHDEDDPNMSISTGKRRSSEDHSRSRQGKRRRLGEVSKFLLYFFV